MKGIYLIDEDCCFMTLVECLDVEKREVVSIEFGKASCLYLDEISYGMLIGFAEDAYKKINPDLSYDSSIAGCALEQYRKNYLFITLLKAFDNFIFEEEIELIGQMMKETYKEIYNESLEETSDYDVVMSSVNELVNSEKIAKYDLVKETNGYKLILKGKSIDDWDF